LGEEKAHIFTEILVYTETTRSSIEDPHLKSREKGIFTIVIDRKFKK